MADIFEFWSRIDRGALIHPADKAVFDRLAPEKHGFQLDCLPGCFAGRLRTASIVMLYLSPGYSKADLDDAASEDGKDYRFRSYEGNLPFRDSGPGLKWLKSRTKVFADFSIVKPNFATLNIGAYHSTNVRSFASLLTLPSSRVSLSWAQEVLFPEAEAGKRIVICMRAAACWGLDVGRRYEGTLFAPAVNRGGYLIKNEENAQLVALVKDRLATS
jgi:hypothetical protein